ncbi:MAG: outer membrane protein assembly factor BamD [Bryobacteraceae bacterium]
MYQNVLRYTGIVAALAALAFSGGCRKKAYENPITKNTQQPDKVLFDSAMSNVEHGRYERARLTLQTLMNTYDNSEYLAKAKLLYADSWFREGGSHGLAQAEAEYKDFILFYPAMEEAAEAQEKICKMQFQQMDKSDRDPTHAFRADDECRDVLVQFPNSKFAPEVGQMLRDIQEILADREYKVGDLYYKKGSFPASANRFQALTEQYPLYSKADEALWQEAEDYQHMGDRFEDQQAAAYARIVKDYPLSAHVEDAKARLEEMKRPVPEADPVALSRMKYEKENIAKRSLMSKMTGPFNDHPNLNTAAKSGTPVMGRLAPTVPYSVPPAASGQGAATNEVTATTAPPASASVLDTKPDARAAGTTGGAAAPADATVTATGAGAAPAAGAGAKPADGSPAAAASTSVGGLASATNPVNSASTATPQNHTGVAAKPKTVKKKTTKKKKSDSTKKTSDTTGKQSDATGGTTTKPSDPIKQQ